MTIDENVSLLGGSHGQNGEDSWKVLLCLTNKNWNLIACQWELEILFQLNVVKTFKRPLCLACSQLCKTTCTEEEDCVPCRVIIVMVEKCTFTEMILLLKCELLYINT